MSETPHAGARVARADPKRAPRSAAFQPTRGWSPPVQPATALKIARPDDAREAAADRAAERALAQDAQPYSGAGPRPDATIRAETASDRASKAPPDLHRRIEAAASEGRGLAREQRGAFERGFGHSFGDVRIHDGPASAVAAASAGARAFTLGRDIYFGAGEFRPGSEPGKQLLAHELAHAIQPQPRVILRRALPGGHLPEPDDVGTAPGAAAVPDNFLDDAPDAASAREKLDALDPATRASALGRAASRMGEDGREKLEAKVMTAEDGGVKGGANSGAKATRAAPAPQGELRAEPPAPAPVSRKREKSAPPPPAHEKAAADAAATMDKAAGLLKADAELEGADGPVGAATPAPSAKGRQKGASAPPSAASMAASETTAALNARLAELAEVRALPAKFQASSEPPGDPVAFARQRESETLARSFVEATAGSVEGLIGEALSAPPQILSGLAAARQNVAAAMAAQAAALNDGADAARKQVESQAKHTHGAIGARRADARQSAEAEAQTAKDRAKAARDKASSGIAKKADAKKGDISNDYRDAEAPMLGVGVQAGDKARQAAAVWKTKLPPYKTDWSVLDGPYENDRIDAKKETADKVAEEYAKSFLASAREQAAKLPDSKPEVMGKVDEIVKQAGSGLTDQLDHIDKGADAFTKGAQRQADVSGAKLSGSLDASAKEITGAMEASRDQQGKALADQAASLHASLDQSGAAALSSLARGVGAASGQLIGSIREFVGSLGSMPPPASQDMAPALEQTRASAEPAIAGMRGQVAAAGPALAETFKTTADQGGKTLAETVGAASQSFAASTQSFGETATGLNRQAAQGFGALRAGSKKTARGLGDDAEKGFAEAETNAGSAFGQFEKQVLDTFKTGRDQMTAGLWSAETRAKLDKDMTDYGEQAAEQIKPRWKSVLKWVITIVVVLAVIAVTVLTAGALGPVGVILLGAALGAAAGAVQTIADNLIDGKPWSQGVVKAMIVGAIGGAVGGAGGVLLKGVGSVALRIGAEAVINVAGGVAGEAVGSLAVHQSIDWTGALMGALIGAGIGAGLGIAGALKGKISVGGLGRSGGAPEIEIEPPPPKPAGKIRVALEKAKILAPGKPAGLPDINVGGAPGGEAPAPAPAAPSEPIGVTAPGEAPAAAPAAEPAPQQPRRAIGFGDQEPIAPKTPPASGEPRPAIGFGDREPIAPKTPPAAEPGPPPAAPKPKEPIGFKLRPAGETPAPAPAAEPTSVPAAPEVEPVNAMSPRPRPLTFEPPAPRLGGGGFEGGMEPIRAGGQPTFEPRAAAEPVGVGAPGGKPHIVEPALAEPAVAETPEPAPAKEPVKPAAEVAPAKAKPSAPAEPASGEPAPPAKEAPPPAAEKPSAEKPAEAGEPAEKTPEQHQQRLKEIRESVKANDERIKEVDKEIAQAKAKRDVRAEKYQKSPAMEGESGPKARELQKARETARQQLASAERKVQALEAKKGAIEGENAKLHQEARAIDEALHPEKYPKTSVEKGDIGEQAGHDHMEKAQGFKKIGSSKQPTSLGGKPASGSPNGIDGVYENPAPPPKYVVGESKYVTDPKAKPNYGESAAGKQDSPEWVDANLDQAVGRAKADQIRAEGYEYWELRYDPKTNTVTPTRKWSTAANKPLVKK
ncbi:MAG TPA: DUF4157 domain-containing protein [Rhodoblastus sp.]|nr:DUF4157 domain-containing protein [Rhodoblastus sp.]